MSLKCGYKAIKGYGDFLKKGSFILFFITWVNEIMIPNNPMDTYNSLILHALCNYQAQRPRSDSKEITITCSYLCGFFV
jgi:hypothetical protein